MKLGKCCHLNTGSTLPEKERMCFAKLWGPAVPEASTNSLLLLTFQSYMQITKRRKRTFCQYLA